MAAASDSDESLRVGDEEEEDEDDARRVAAAAASFDARRIAMVVCRTDALLSPPPPASAPAPIDAPPKSIPTRDGAGAGARRLRTGAGRAISNGFSLRSRNDGSLFLRLPGCAARVATAVGVANGARPPALSCASRRLWAFAREMDAASSWNGSSKGLNGVSAVALLNSFAPVLPSSSPPSSIDERRFET